MRSLIALGLVRQPSEGRNYEILLKMVPIAISLETFEAGAAAAAATAVALGAGPEQTARAVLIALRALPRAAAAAVQHPTQCFSLHASDKDAGDGSSASTEMGSTSADSREQQMNAQRGVSSHADMVSPRGAGMGSECELLAEEEPVGLINGCDVAADCLGGFDAKSWGKKVPDSPSGGCLSLRPEAARFSEVPEDTGVSRCLPYKEDDSYHCGDQPHTLGVPTPSQLESDMESEADFAAPAAKQTVQAETSVAEGVFVDGVDLLELQRAITCKFGCGSTAADAIKVKIEDALSLPVLQQKPFGDG